MYVDLKKPTLFLFTDASADPQTGIGYGAYLLIPEFNLEAPISKHKIKTKKFKNTTSSKLELETLLWALSKIPTRKCKIIVYTDCQNIINLKNREERIVKNNYMNKKNVLIKNHKLYKKFYTVTDHYECDFIKVKGHKKTKDKDMVDIFFTLVDKASREALRKR
ncbi:MAG: ribonuclease H [Sulfurimonas sp. RIFCSPHIGHO2_12_FULL_36_9]|uniref:ribonuclease HI n=1 Tax=Sulfurimonas sp. RIFCSPLOWO2_12_36_12 TaxID=1802253 RepID=UPI0008C49692|nr:RNase H family protein [Sulfurimonas sp. RIFCSPLOWO2_12_36_12]OHD96270.1 MAG: ribonuclease H [Sulfurimonas sp. RIFCSPHIGHO2_12_FULL_36_9]OHE01893.1 MAG: ribonuclease H [Sulfurimonas sp. RIFCSPLOWO2_12_36_12]OHE02147.1 MAG: ribonuclease H [Sulfurimonas sp. RIFCSPLOWO2_12_FULL_36_74]